MILFADFPTPFPFIGTYANIICLYRMIHLYMQKRGTRMGAPLGTQLCEESL